MKLVIASDIHGAQQYCRKLMDALDTIQPDRLVLLGDLLYHGPRNDVPADYAPKQVLSMLNSIHDQIIAVRGNCEAEVDQMVLDFPCMAEYNVILDLDCKNPGADGKPIELFCTHGHVYGPGNVPNLPDGSVLVYGHTHVKVNGPLETVSGGGSAGAAAGTAAGAGANAGTKANGAESDGEAEARPGIRMFNPGSVGIPKDGTHSYGVYEAGEFSHVVID